MEEITSEAIKNLVTSTSILLYTTTIHPEQYADLFWRPKEILGENTSKKDYVYLSGAVFWTPLKIFREIYQEVRLHIIGEKYHHSITRVHNATNLQLLLKYTATLLDQ